MSPSAAAENAVTVAAASFTWPATDGQLVTTGDVNTALTVVTA
jgi:hypothetical protein